MTRRALRPSPALALRLRAMREADLDRVLLVEGRCYSHPWTRGNFSDALAAGYLARLLVDGADDIAAYVVAMHGVDELHLLNLTVAPDWQRAGHACALLDLLEAHCREHGLPTLWLEVRAGNARALHVYRRRGFAEVGRRPDYYPTGAGRREDAIVMCRAVPGVWGDA
jgi:ribosomal-protein-alanine N-acetyltransferase